MRDVGCTRRLPRPKEDESSDREPERGDRQKAGAERAPRVVKARGKADEDEPGRERQDPVREKSLHKDGHEDRVERSQLDLPERGAGARAPERNERGSQAVESARKERSRRPRPGECTQHEESKTRAFDGLARHVGAHPRPKIVARRPVSQRKDVPRV